MKTRWLHVALTLLVIFQPAVSAAAWAAMMATQVDGATSHHSGLSGTVVSGMAMSGMAMSGMSMSDRQISDRKMAGCHGAEADVPRCCEAMDGVACGMDCGTASPAVHQPPLLLGVTGHGAFEPALPCAAPSSPPTILYRPPRTC